MMVDIVRTTMSALARPILITLTVRSMFVNRITRKPVVIPTLAMSRRYQAVD